MLERLGITSRTRKWLTFIGSWAVGCAYLALWVTDYNPKFEVLPALYVSAFFVAPFLNRLDSLAARLTARAFWWQSTFLYTLLGGYGAYRIFERHGFDVSISSVDWEFAAACIIWTGPIVALLAAGSMGLDADSKHFAPVRFRKTMLASLLLGAADLMALTMYATITLYDLRASDLPEGLALTGGALAMGVALFGLFRMRVWGLGLCVVTNVVVAAMALSGVLGIPDLLAGGLVATAVAQLIVPVPMIREIARGLRRGLPAAER